MISICCPSRSRAARCAQMYESVQATAVGDVEVIVVVDPDDPELSLYDVMVTGDTQVENPGLVHSNLWNLAWRYARGDIAMLGADDLMFRTVGWDVMVEETIRARADGILMVYGDDGSGDQRATHPFVSREWIEAAGGFTPRHFPSWYADRWIWEVADMVGRSRFLPDVNIDHLHPSFGKADGDETYERGEQARAAKDWKAIYRSKLAEREAQARALRAVMA